MTVSEPREQDLKWVILTRQRTDDLWDAHRHHKGTPFKYTTLDNTVGDVRTLRRRGLQAMAVREDRCYPVYKVLV